jgi:predicted transposase/invertase (TIGR01784 family)
MESELKERLWESLPTGNIRYGLTNDYMFRAVMQRNEKALKGLLYALLNLPENSITDLLIMNPIELGKSIDKKDCVLDIKVKINNARIINVEMQVNNLGNWTERSLVYLCRAFDQLEKGEDYGEIKPTVHIGILDFSLEHLTPELYSEFKMMNVKNHEVYSDKFILRVLNLSVLDKGEIVVNESTELYDWAKLFKAQSWEEMKRLAENNEYMKETVFTLHEMTEEEKIREQCEAREKYNWDMWAAKYYGREEGMRIAISTFRELEIEKEEAIKRLVNRYNIPEQDAKRYVDLYWEKDDIN